MSCSKDNVNEELAVLDHHARKWEQHKAIGQWRDGDTREYSCTVGHSGRPLDDYRANAFAVCTEGAWRSFKNSACLPYVSCDDGVPLQGAEWHPFQVLTKTFVLCVHMCMRVCVHVFVCMCLCV
ncbi:MAG: hypothetical protein MHM6MM_007478, partial [Cercozoa sp. M6MM]